MNKPDYHGGSIVNLMSTIAARFGGSSLYPSLTTLPPEQLAGAEKIVLLLIDGLGYSYLQEHGKGSALLAHLKGKMTSVFPSTTAAAVSSFYTGVAPQNHGIMGWFMYLRELGLVSVILRTTIRATKQTFLTKTITPQKIFQVDSFFNKIKAKGFVVQPNDLRPSPYNQVIGGSAQHIGHRNLKSLFANVKKILGKTSGHTYVMGYYPGFDATAHKYGVQSAESQLEFEAIDRNVGVFLEELNVLEPKTAVIITADHGLVDCPPERTIWLNQHPMLDQCLAVPLCAESRAAFCYVRPSKVSQFETYVQDHLAHAFTLLSYEELLSQEFFGLFEPYPRLFDRVGDYVLVAKDNYMLREDLLGEERETLIGHHGGVSEQEMFVPLVSNIKL
jgi:hypothetical protein